LRLVLNNRVAVLLAFCLALPLVAQDAPAPTTQPQTSASPASDNDASTSASRQRIVDPAKFPPQTPFVGRVFLAPFRAMAPAVQSGLTTFEESRLRQRIQAWFGREFYEDDLPPEARREHRHLHYKLKFSTVGAFDG
jgi:hypothetical protein